jgi:uncharacterized membrane protein
MLDNRRLPLLVCAGAFFIWVILLLYKYYHLGYNDWDLAFFTQACWQLLHGSQFTSVTGINYFGDHSYFITFFILPSFAFAPHPLTLVMLKLIAYIVAAYLFYKIALEALGPKTALVLMVLYLLFPVNIFSLLYEFNPENFVPPVLFWMFWAFQKRRWRSFLIASCLLMLIKENMPLLVGAFGVYGLFSRHCPRKIAWFSLFSGIAAFYILVVYVVPYFRHLAYHAFIVRYDYLGNSPGEMLSFIFTHPQKIIKVIFSGLNRQYIQSLFGPLLWPALFGWRLLFLMLPILLQHLFSLKKEEHSIYFHYGATLAPFIFLAVLHTLSLCKQELNRMIFRIILFLLIILSAMNLCDYSKAFVGKLDYHSDRLGGVRWDFVNAVPSQAGVIATFDYLAPLALRHDLYAFHKVYDDSYQDLQDIKINELNVGRAFVLPDQVRYALIDFKDAWLQKDLNEEPKSTHKRIRAFLENSNWKIIKHYGSIVLLKR